MGFGSFALPQWMSGIPGKEVHVWKATPQLRLLFSQDDEGATHEKLDFRLHFSCSSYLITTPCYRCVCLHPSRNPSQGREGAGAEVIARCEVEVT